MGVGTVVGAGVAAAVAVGVGAAVGAGVTTTTEPGLLSQPNVINRMKQTITNNTRFTKMPPNIVTSIITRGIRPDKRLTVKYRNTKR